MKGCCNLSCWQESNFIIRFEKIDIIKIMKIDISYFFFERVIFHELEAVKYFCTYSSIWNIWQGSE